jgi:hypothetical protein
MGDKVIQLLGNGDNATMFNDKKCKGTRLICNLPPFEVTNVFATCMVDFKIMASLTEGTLNLDAYEWVLGFRPRIWMDQHPGFYMQKAKNIKTFYDVVPEYAGNATNFNCGHMATHYACNRLKAKEVHMYGFDSIFDHNMRSISDLYLMSDRGDMNNYRLLNNWRPIWTDIFKEFDSTQFILYHRHSNSKIHLPENVEVRNKL